MDEDGCVERGKKEEDSQDGYALRMAPRDSEILEKWERQRPWSPTAVMMYLREKRRKLK